VVQPQQEFEFDADPGSTRNAALEAAQELFGEMEMAFWVRQVKSVAQGG
jgi:hypothetical protein